MSNLWKTYNLPVETLWNVSGKVEEKIRIAKGHRASVALSPPLPPGLFHSLFMG
ncbi:MAG: hypothetical protein QQW96_13315 [Tychonema bourrellyi B0820]|uniref:hypothetical protein n=1 Tax=Tychonema bourrellyi TaxID=54313 RepID=UPI0015D4CAE5|nr:hypothetical protein [Tychonema bourrellyi]MDQ2098615.1 hypothetical protein [Tychonema bourrellyi B0820]